jgi:D-xylose 1-dehydrogenase (NADP+, D-xylono-1,5-lactone-forming)
VIVIRLALLSTAQINGEIIDGAAACELVSVVGVASRNPARAKAYALEHGLDRSWRSYDELLAEPDVDAVYVALPNALHVEWSIRALEAGKHVLCEKVLDKRADRVAEAFDTAERADRFLMEGFMYRHHPQTKRLSELVADGAIGELRLVRAAFSFSLTELGDVRMRPELDGGSVTDVGCYGISAIRLLAGEPESVTATEVLGSTGVDVRFAGTLALPGDVLGYFDCAFDLPYRSELEVVGSEGVIRVVDPFTIGSLGIGGSGIEVRRGDEVEVVRAGDENHYQLELDNLSDAIRGIADPLLGREDAVAQARAIEALYRAAEGGVVVELD